MLKAFICSSFLPLLSFSCVLLPNLPSVAQSNDELTNVQQQSYARAKLLNGDVLTVLENWIKGSHAFEEGKLQIAQESFKSNINRIEKLAAKEYHQCFSSFNAVLLQSANKNQSPDFLSLDSGCFNNVILLLSNYSASH